MRTERFSAVPNETLTRLRKEYALKTLDESSVDPNPSMQFRRWFEEVLAAKLVEPNALVLATVAPDGRPSSRVVLMKELDERGVVFFTNYESRKGGELESNPHAAALFYWAELERQVRVEGEITKVSSEESEEYFRTRPFESQLGAWASQQSSVISDRGELEDRMTKLRARYESREVPLPPYWGGYRLRPRAFEFWQGRHNRLHDRIRYTLTDDTWVIERLSP